MELLRGIVERENISGAVTFHGWVDHARVAEYLGRADVLGFPSVREFGGGVALEAMSMGVAPLIVDYGGPGELVSPATGIAVPMGNRREIVERVRAALERLVSRPELAREMGARGRARVARHFTWDAKAAREVELYEWLLRRRERPVFPMPIPDEELGAMESA